jgi:PAS domain S-box-containing protein
MRISSSTEPEISCRISHTLLMYVREQNDGSLGDLLEGLDLDEPYLLDTNNWISHDFLQTLYQRMIRILGDEDAVYKMALATMRFGSYGILDRIARLTKDPKIGYSHITKYNRMVRAKGDVFVHELGDSWALVEERYHYGSKKTRCDCDYMRGVLAGMPTFFDMPVAHVEEIECQVSADKYGNRTWPDAPVYGAKGCLYRVRFVSHGPASFWKRVFQSGKAYQNATEYLLQTNQQIQEKYREARRLASELEEANRKLVESKKQLESKSAALEASERRYRLLAENVTDIIWVLNLETMRYDYVSPSVQKMLGYSAEEAMESGIEEIVVPESLERALNRLQEEMDAEETGQADPDRSAAVELLQRRKDGTHVWVEAKVTFVRDEQGRPIAIQGVSRDISDRKQGEEALMAEKERLRITIRSIGEGVISTDRNGCVALMNQVAEALTGYTEAEAMGRDLAEIFRIAGPEALTADNGAFEKGIDAESGLSLDKTLIHRDGAKFLIAHTAAPILDADRGAIGSVLVFRDITQQRKMEQELSKLDKLESLGVLAGGIAHDFNNFLAGIIGNLSLAKTEANPSEKVFSRLERMENAALLANNLTYQLLTFAKGGAPVKQSAQLMDLVKESATFAATSSNVRCNFTFPPDLHASEIDRGQISQVIHNLVLNGIQVMPQGGVIEVTGENIRLSSNNELALPEGDYVRLTVQDQGPGIEEQDLKRVFDPYFTTKDKGNGLGLAVVYSIIDEHKGRITVDSPPGCGARFSIYLPAASVLETDQTVESLRQPAMPGRRILVMDDEEYIRDMISEMLDLMGHTAITVKNGEEAIRAYEEALKSAQPFDGVILDLTIPGGMGGKETLKALLEMDKDVRAMVASGYSNDPVMSDYVRYGFRSALKKPYRLAQVQEALDAIL